MEIALFHNHFDEAHLQAVKAEMETLGAPTIKAVWMECWGVWAALEGCHRLRAAAQLGLIPEIEEIEYSDEITTDDIGMSDDFGGDVWTIGEIASDAYNKTTITFED